MAETRQSHGKVLLVATEDAEASNIRAPAASNALGPAVEALDQAMADIDRLLARTGGQQVTGT